MMKRTILIAAGLTVMLSAAAQPGGSFPQQKPERPQMKERPSVEQEAQIKTDQMSAELSLDEKQIKKVYKFFKNDIKYRRENFEFAGPFRGGNLPAPPSGGFPGGGKGGFPGGGPQGMRPGNPPSGMPAFGGEVDYEEIEKYNAKQDKKLRKIIGEENFEKWIAAHPHEAPKMPELELQLPERDL